MGVVFLLLGLANKAKWKSRPPLTPEQRKLKLVLVIGTVLLVLLTFAFRFDSSDKDFQLKRLKQKGSKRLLRDLQPVVRVHTAE
jgi:hypothetical protein